MIETGTKVIVLSSSCRKKTGPKRGSTGFISQEKWINSGIAYFDREDVFVNLTKVVFTRYGFETKKRTEAKYFVNVLPSFLTKQKMGHQYLERAANIEKFRSFEEVRNRWVDTYGKKLRSIYTGIMVPIPPVDTISMEENDFCAWLFSFLYDKKFIRLLEAINAVYRRLEGVVDRQLVRMLIELSADARYRRDMFPLIAGDGGMRESVVNLIRKATSIGKTAEYKQKKAKTHKWFEDHRIKSTEYLISTGYFLTESFYSYPELLWKADAIKTLNNSSSAIGNTLLYLLGTREKLLCLGQALEESGEEGKEEVPEEKPVPKEKISPKLDKAYPRSYSEYRTYKMGL